jgi:hypothetical protein
VIHSSELKAAKFKELCEGNKRVVVIGGSKSGSDVVVSKFSLIIAFAYYRNINSTNINELSDKRRKNVSTSKLVHCLEDSIS